MMAMFPPISSVVLRPDGRPASIASRRRHRRRARDATRPLRTTKRSAQPPKIWAASSAQQFRRCEQKRRRAMAEAPRLHEVRGTRRRLGRAHRRHGGTGAPGTGSESTPTWPPRFHPTSTRRPSPGLRHPFSPRKGRRMTKLAFF